MRIFDRLHFRDDDDDAEYAAEDEKAPAQEGTRGVSPSGKAKKQFVLFRPNDSSDEQLLTIADHLLERECVILNLEMIAKDSRHFVDFLSGVAFALQGQTKKIATNTFLITPGGVEVSGDIASTLEPDLKF
jgi:cell division inhibitor SepF